MVSYSRYCQESPLFGDFTQIAAMRPDSFGKTGSPFCEGDLPEVRLHPDRRIAEVATERLAIGFGYRHPNCLDILTADAVGAKKPQCLKNELYNVVLDAEAAHRSMFEANLEVSNVDRSAGAGRQIFRPGRDLRRQVQRVEREGAAREDG